MDRTNAQKNAIKKISGPDWIYKKKDSNGRPLHRLNPEHIGFRDVNGKYHKGSILQ